MREDKDTGAQALRPLRGPPPQHTQTHTLSPIWDSVECALYLSLLVTDLSCRSLDLFMSLMQTWMSEGKWSWLGCGTAGYCVCVCMACHATPCSFYLTYTLYIIFLLHLSLPFTLSIFISQSVPNKAVNASHSAPVISLCCLLMSVNPILTTSKHKQVAKHFSEPLREQVSARVC